jgi:glutathione S-transferase
MMKLFWTPASPFVRKVMVTAIELGLRDRIEIHPTYWPHEWGSRTIEFDAEFIGANPVGRIPALVTDGGIAIVESNWICQHLDSLTGTPRLLPAFEPMRLQCTRLLGIADGALEAMIARRAELLRDSRDQSASFIAKQRDRIRRCIDAIDREITTLGGPLTLAQIAVGVACGYLDFRYPADNWRSERPRLTSWYEIFATRTSMRETMPAETPQRQTTE